MPEIITQSIQDYLKHIYELNEHGGAASTNDLAARLNVAPASVTGMLQKLASAKPPLVDLQKASRCYAHKKWRESRTRSHSSPSFA